MKNLLESTNFYNDLILSQRDLNTMFKELSILGGKKDFQILFENLGERLEKDFGTVIYNVTKTHHQEKFNIPEPLFQRVSLATTLVHLMGCGCLYSEKLLKDTITYLKNVPRDKPLN